MTIHNSAKETNKQHEPFSKFFWEDVFNGPCTAFDLLINYAPISDKDIVLPEVCVTVWWGKRQVDKQRGNWESGQTLG